MSKRSVLEVSLCYVAVNLFFFLVHTRLPETCIIVSSDGGGGVVKSIRPSSLSYSFFFKFEWVRDAGDREKNKPISRITPCKVIPLQSVNFFSFSAATQDRVDRGTKL